MKTFHLEKFGMTCPAAVAVFDQLVINVSAKTFFVRFLVYASKEALLAGAQPLDEIKFSVSETQATELAQANEQLYDGIIKAAYAIAAPAFPEDAKDA